MLSNFFWLCLSGALSYWLSCEVATLLLQGLTPVLGLVDALLWTQLAQLGLLLVLAVALLLVRRQSAMHALTGLVVLPLAMVISWSGTLALYRAELDLALTPALQPARQADISTLPSAAQQVRLALLWQQQQHPTAAQLYIELASARKPYLTLHLQQPGSWTLTRQWLLLPATDSPSALSHDNDTQAGLTPLGDAITLSPGNSRVSVGELFFSVHYQLAGLLKRSAQPLLVGLCFAVLAMSCAGLYLFWQRWRRGTALFGRGPLRWHLLAALVSLPWLGWFFGSALFTQFGSWHPGLLQESNSAAYYQALFPQPLLNTADPAADPTETAVTAVDLTSLLNTPGWPVAKVQRDLASGRYLLTEQPAWPATPPYQLRQQTLDAQGQVLPQADYWPGPVWQLRNLAYAAHQSLYAGPGLRAVLAVVGVLVVLMLYAAAEGYGRKRSWWFLALCRALTGGYLLATLLLLMLNAVPMLTQQTGIALLPLLGWCWFCCGLGLCALTYWQYRWRR